MKDIPIHQMQGRAGLGLQIKHFVRDAMPDDIVEKLGVHRDDHYMFFLMENGISSIMVDFQEMYLHKSSICYILPGQVHYPVKSNKPSGWYMAVDTMLIPPDYRMFLKINCYCSSSIV